MKHIVICLFIIFVCSCRENRQAEGRVLHVDPDNLSVFDVTAIAEFEKMIPLETTDECLIKQIRQVFLADSFILVWDEDRQRIFVFNDKGKYLHDIGHRGAGPNEYAGLENIHVNPATQTVSLLDNRKRLIMTYHVSGNLVSSEPLPYYAYAFYPSLEGYWIYHSLQGEKYNLLLLNSETKEIEEKYLPAHSFFPLIRSNNFSTNERNEIFFHYPYEEVLYRIEGTKLNPCLYIDFGSRKNPFRDIRKENYSGFIQRNEYAGKIRNVFMHGDKLFFTFMESYGKENNRVDIYHVFARLEDLSAIVYTTGMKHAEEITVQPLSELLGLSEGRLVYQLNPNIMPDGLIEKIKEMNPVKKALYNNISQESNPILVLYRLKT
jgi:hypothetical protein